MIADKLHQSQLFHNDQPVLHWLFGRNAGFIMVVMSWVMLFGAFFTRLSSLYSLRIKHKCFEGLNMNAGSRCTVIMFATVTKPLRLKVKSVTHSQMAHCQSACLVCGRSGVRIPCWVIPITLKVVHTASLPSTWH